MFENINLTIVAIVAGLAVIGMIFKIATGDTAIKQDKSCDDGANEYFDRRSAATAGTHDPYYSDFPSHRDND